MKRWQKVLVSIGVIAVLMAGFATWYRIHFSMAPAKAFEVAGAVSAPRVLIATQGSEFKDSVVAGVVADLRKRQAYVKVIDISGLASEKPADWSAIVVLHTWEMRKPPEAVKTFIDNLADRRSLVVMSTSGAGDFRIEGIDAISAASRLEDVPTRVAQITARIDVVLAARGHGRT